ncbi:MAG: hypothetical protein IT385_12890 [Deltaproteobacteria bacterium]|nr:hypothetical protein [Deltaproteobacteria bacterium]
MFVAVLAACGDMADGGVAPNDVGPTLDTSIFDTGTATSTTDATSSDTTTPTDAVFPDTRLPETTAPLTSLKDDPTYLVPGNVSSKTEVTAFERTVAWVETPRDGGPFLVVWDPTSEDGARTFFVPNLIRPRQLALSRELLVYVDDRYGDPDVFAVDLVTGDATTVVARRGAQERPTVLGRRVAWADCRACVTGDDGAGWEIWTRDGDEPEARLSDDATPDRAPTFGVLSGDEVLAWISGRSELRVVGRAVLDGGAGRDERLDVASELRASEAVGWLAVTPGALAYRTRPLIVNPDSMIVNPDSMYPSDVLVSEVVAGVLGGTTRLTRHGELRDGVDGSLRAAGARLAWIASRPIDGGAGGAETLVLTEGLVTTDTIDEPGLTTFGLGASLLAFVAPRADNDGLPDAWVLPLD